MMQTSSQQARALIRKYSPCLSKEVVLWVTTLDSLIVQRIREGLIGLTLELASLQSVSLSKEQAFNLSLNVLKELVSELAPSLPAHKHQHPLGLGGVVIFSLTPKVLSFLITRLQKELAQNAKHASCCIPCFSSLAIGA